MKKSVAVTVAVAAVILITAFAALAVLTAIAGQESGLEKSSAVRCATPHSERPTAHALCTTPQGG